MRVCIVGLGIGMVLGALGVHLLDRPWAFIVATLVLYGVAEVNRVMA